MASPTVDKQSVGLGDSAGIHACLVNLSPSADGAIQIFPAGEFAVPNGAMRGTGPWRMDETHAKALIARVAARKNPLVLDYEHQSLLTAQNGQPAPAAGWIPSDGLEWRPDGLYATRIEWTERARAMIAGGEYRFLSPVFRADSKGHPIDLLNVALTNNPAIDGMQPVVTAARAFFPESTATRAESSTDLIDQPKRTAMTAIINAALGLAEDADEAAALAAINALKAPTEPDPARYAPVSVLQDMQAQLAALKADQLHRDVRDLIEPALVDGRLLPAQKEWAEELGATNIAALKGYLDTAQPIAALKSNQTSGKAPAGNGGSAGALSEAELVICSRLGIAAEDFMKAREVH
jgi:phage I-like protein